MPRSVYVILASFLIVYIVLNLFSPGGLMAYILPSVCWAALALVTLYVAGLERILSWTNNRITLMALLAAVFQIFILMDAGIINKFGNSPMSFEPMGISINFMMVSSTLLGMELSRGYLVKNLRTKNPTLTLAAVTLLYTFANVSILMLTDFGDSLTYTKFMGQDFLPALTENLLATYLALMSGPIASLAYRAPLQAFQWFSPILPDLSWGYQSIIGVMTPTIGFIAINAVTTQTDLRKSRTTNTAKTKAKTTQKPIIDERLASYIRPSGPNSLVINRTAGLLPNDSRERQHATDSKCWRYSHSYICRSQQNPSRRRNSILAK